MVDSKRLKMNISNIPSVPETNKVMRLLNYMQINSEKSHDWKHKQKMYLFTSSKLYVTLRRFFTDG